MQVIQMFSDIINKTATSPMKNVILKINFIAGVFEIMKGVKCKG